MGPQGFKIGTLRCSNGLDFPAGAETSHGGTSIVVGGQSKSSSSKGKKLGHRRVGGDGEVTFKKFQTTQLIGSIQLGMQQSIGSLANQPDRDLLIKDFKPIETV